MAVSVVSFSFSRAAQPEAQRPNSLLDDGFLYCILSPTGLVPKLHRGPRGPLRPGVVFPTTSCLRRLCSSTVWLPVFTELYNSSTPTQSPTQSLEWHVWSSSSGNNCHAVYRSLSSGASVYECTMGIFPCPILLAKSACAISPHKCHRNVSLPSGASLWNDILGRVKGQYTTLCAYLFVWNSPNLLLEVSLQLFFFPFLFFRFSYFSVYSFYHYWLL